MEYLQRLLDKIDRFELLIAGLIGVVVASWWHKDDLSDWRAWMVFLITGVACSLYLTSMVSAYTVTKYASGLMNVMGPNRVLDGKATSWWGEGYAGVCLKPWQFNCWNQNDSNYAYLSGAKPIPAAQFAQAQRAADQVMAGAVPDPTGGATHYYATTMPKAPAWAAGAKQTLRLGHHVFFKDVP